jgi:hypothetical protein
MTDIYPALRSEIEAVEEVADVRNWGPPEMAEWNSAVAALCAKVEALMGFSYGNGWNDSTLDKGDGERFAPDASADSLLNEEPKDGGS